jgi:CRP-like cAMP-binding protein
MTTDPLLLASVPLFHGLPRQELVEIVRTGSEREFAPGDPIVEAGLEAMDFYLVLEGQATLTVPGRPPASIGPGSYFGEMSVLDGEPRSATVVAETRVLALRIARQDFVALLDRNGRVARRILEVVVGRLRRAEEQAVHRPES